MGQAPHTNHSPGSLLRRLLPVLSLDRIVLLADLYRVFRTWLIRPDRGGMYQILDYDSTLEMVDPKGKTAHLKKRQRVKFNQDYIIAFQDFAWGSGECLADYKCSPGVVVDRYLEGDRWNILISLRETKSRGEIEDFFIERTAINGFTKAEEWWQIEIRHPTSRLKLAAIFPQSRRCQKAVLLQRSRHRSTILGPDHFTDLPDGRQVLTWEARKINCFEIFTIKWKW